MKKYGYQAFENHKMEHNKYTSTLVEIYQKHHGGALVGQEILELIKFWLKDYIMKTDRDLGLFLNSIWIE